MITQEQIEGWLREIDERPSSASLIIQFISNRLRELTGRNEELLAENIALLSGKRVEELEQRIVHLEYQIELLKRQILEGAQQSAVNQNDGQISAFYPNLLLYNSSGRLIRLKLAAKDFDDGRILARLAGWPITSAEPIRLAVIQEADELFFLFSSGRIELLTAAKLPILEPRTPQSEPGQIAWASAKAPVEPSAGESLVCVTPITRMALADFFVQASRKGYLKKTPTSMGQLILSSRYIGSGVKQPADQAFELALAGRDDQVLLVSYEGYCACIEIRRLSYSVEEALRLAATDHLMAVFGYLPERTLLVMTQTGKLLQQSLENLEPAASLKTRGLALFSQKRREAGIRVIGAGAVRVGDWAAALHQDGTLTIHSVKTLLNSGSMPVFPELIAFTTFSNSS